MKYPGCTVCTDAWLCPEHRAAVEQLVAERKALPTAIDRVAFDNVRGPCGVPQGLLVMAFEADQREAQS